MTDTIIGKTSEEVVTGFINLSNNTNFEASYFSFSDVTEQAGTRDTKIKVTALPQSGMSGSFDFYYSRLHLSEYFRNGVSIRIVRPFNTLDVIDAINAKYGLKISSHDMTIESNVSTSEYELHANPKSVLWRGSVTVEVSDPLRDVSSLIELNTSGGYGLYPEPDRIGFHETYGFISFDTNLSELWIPEVGKTIDVSIARIVAKVIPGNWSYRVDIPDVGNLADTHCVYAGVNEGEWAVDEDTTARLLVLRIGDLCTSHYGYIILKFWRN